MSGSTPTGRAWLPDENKADRRDKKREAKRKAIRKHGRTIGSLYTEQILSKLDKS